MCVSYIKMEFEHFVKFEIDSANTIFMIHYLYDKKYCKKKVLP